MNNVADLANRYKIRANICTSHFIKDIPRHELGKSMNTTACNFEKSAHNALSYLTVYTKYIYQNIIYSYFRLLQQTFPICLLQLTFSCKPSNRLKRQNVKNIVNLMEINLSNVQLFRTPMW